MDSRNRKTKDLFKQYHAKKDSKKSAFIPKEEYESLISDILEAKQSQSKTLLFTAKCRHVSFVCVDFPVLHNFCVIFFTQISKQNLKRQ